jgi:hypothetical protein
MNLSRKLIIPAIAASALMAGVLAGAPAALASTSAAAAPTAVVSVSHPASSNIPESGGHWEYWNTYSTLQACLQEGDNIEESGGGLWNTECVQTEGYGGAYWEYDLYIWFG